MKKVVTAGKTVGDLVVEGKLTTSAEEPTHAYDVETKKIEKIELAALPVTPPAAKPHELNEWDIDRLNEKRAKSEIIWRLTERRDLYTAHCEDRSTSRLHIQFYTPFLSPVELFARVKFDVPGLRPFEFDSVVEDLIQDGKVVRVSEKTHSLDTPNDFRDARLGELFLGTQELIAAYELSITLSRKFHEKISSSKE
jgi:hypothetical protein